MHPGLVNRVTELAGIDYLANAGGAVHGHPGGTIAGATAMRQAIDKTYGLEYDQAITKWGLIK
jgi:ribulose 1,5-bisphosphate carboxylase large subunit-like protein